MRSDAYTQMIQDVARRVRMVWDATVANSLAAKRAAPEYAFALAEGHYELCADCGAWGGALELPGYCGHAAEVRTRRPCWVVVTAEGECMPLTAALLKAFQPDTPGNAGGLRAGGQVAATLEAAPTHSNDEPVVLLEEGIIAAPNQDLLRLAPSGRMSTLRPADAVMGPLVYTCRYKPIGWPV